MTQISTEIFENALSNKLPEYNRLAKYGKSLIGKKAQSRLLMELNANGRSHFAPAQVITDFEIVEMFKEPTLMVTIDGLSVLETTLFNIH